MHPRDRFLHKEAQRTANEAILFSGSRCYSFQKPIRCDSLEKSVQTAILDLAGELSTEGIILGHIKGALRLPNGSGLSLSCTLAHQVDTTILGNWKPDTFAVNCIFTADILCLRPAQFDGDAFLLNLFESNSN